MTFGTIPNTATTIGITVTFIFYGFLAPWQDPSICLSFRFLLFSLNDPMEQQNPLEGKFFFLVNKY